MIEANGLNMAALVGTFTGAVAPLDSGSAFGRGLLLHVVTYERLRVEGEWRMIDTRHSVAVFEPGYVRAFEGEKIAANSVLSLRGALCRFAAKAVPLGTTNPQEQARRFDFYGLTIDATGSVAVVSRPSRQGRGEMPDSIRKMREGR